MTKLCQVFLCCWLLLGIPALAPAATVLQTDFDGATTTVYGDGNPNLDGVSWITDVAITAGSTVASFETHELGNIAPSGAINMWGDNVGVDFNLNSSRSTPRGIIASFTVASGSALLLNDFTIGHTHTSNSGTGQVYSSDMTVTLTNVTDSIVKFTDTTNYNYSRVWVSSTYDLSGIILDGDKDYTITLTMQDMEGGGAYAAWNEIIVTGEVLDDDKARLINPNGNNVPVDAVLQWEGPTAFTATGYDVYFGTNSNVYANPKVVSNEMVTSYDPNDGGVLDSNTTYYWVVDSYGTTPSPVPGDLWSFTTIRLPGDAAKVTEWKFDTAYPDGPDWVTADSSGQGNDGTFVNPPGPGPTLVSGVVGNSLKLTGDNDGVVKEDATFLPWDETEPWTINLYLYLNGKPNDWTRIANVGDNYQRQLFVYRDSEIGFILWDKYLLLTGTQLLPDRWYMLTVTYDSSYLRLFIDGAEVASRQLPFDVSDELDPELNLLHYAHAGTFSGRVDELTVWDHTLPPDTMSQLAAMLPKTGDTDNSGDVWLGDLGSLAANWLEDHSIAPAEMLLEDFQSYTGDTDPAFITAWQAAVQGGSTLNLSSGEMTWNYDLETGRDAGVYHWRAAPVDLSQYDQLHLRVYKNTGSTGDRLYCKFIELDTDGTLWDMGEAALSGGLAAVPEGTWFDWVINLNSLVTWDDTASEVPYDRIKDLDGLRIGIQSETGGLGNLIIDDLKLVRTSPRCEASGFIIGDLNGNCRVDLVDLSLFAENWLN